VNKHLDLAKEFLNTSNSDGVAVAIMDFKTDSFRHFELEGSKCNEAEGKIYFDLASLTKPLVNGFGHISEQIVDEELELLLNHRAGIPAWGLLPKTHWRDLLLKYKIQESETVYSDYSALRYILC
jgi:hypothetical protein